MSQVILPTATNYLTYVSEKILEARRLGVPVALDVTTQRRRAWQIVKETSPLPVASVTQ
jgi:hypothetical protein